MTSFHLNAKKKIILLIIFVVVILNSTYSQNNDKLVKNKKYNPEYLACKASKKGQIAFVAYIGKDLRKYSDEAIKKWYQDNIFKPLKVKGEIILYREMQDLGPITKTTAYVGGSSKDKWTMMTETELGQNLLDIRKEYKNKKVTKH